MAVMSKPINKPFVVSSKEMEKMLNNKLTKEKYNEICRLAKLLESKDRK